MNRKIAATLAGVILLGLSPLAGAKPTDVSGVSAKKKKPVLVRLSGKPMVRLSGTPTVQLSGTPTVQLSGTPTVQLSGTPTVQLSGTPTVQLSGTPSVAVQSSQTQPVFVQPARQPFQQFVSGSTNSGEQCEKIEVPAGKRLTIESFSADATAADKPNVYLLTSRSAPGITNAVRAVLLDLRARGTSAWAGDVTTLLHSGAESNGAGVFSYSACVAPNGGLATFRGFVSGWLE